eukprot:jgi/Astpho2/5590/fgenesh1_pg.00079_%23_47_t
MLARHPLTNKFSTTCTCRQDKRLEEAAALQQGLEAQLQQRDAQLAAFNMRQQQQQVDALQRRLEREQAARAAAEAEAAALRGALDQGREWVQQAQKQQVEAERLRAEIVRLQVKVSTGAMLARWQTDKQQQEADQANLLELVEQTRAVVDKAQVDQGAHEAELQSMRDHYERMHSANNMRRQRNLALEQHLGTLQKENADLCFQLQRAEARVAQLSSVLGQDMIAQSSLPGIPETCSSRRSSRAGSRTGALLPPGASTAAKRHATHAVGSFVQLFPLGCAGLMGSEVCLLTARPHWTGQQL